MIESDDDFKLAPPEIPHTFPSWAPESAVDWLRSYGGLFDAAKKDRLVSLLTDIRMKDVWHWYRVAYEKASNLRDRDAVARKIRDQYVWLMVKVNRRCSLPSFPGNLSASEREEYFAKIRRHAFELIDLLQSTPYSRSGEMARRRPIRTTPEDAATGLRDELDSWGPENSGHVVAFLLDQDGLSLLPWHYPESSVCDLLQGVIAWTHQDDHWDWGSLSSKPIERAKGRGTRVAYFTRSLFESLEQIGIDARFNHLATLANVALNLSASDEVDEDAVRKQVRRYQSAKSREDREVPW